MEGFQVGEPGYYKASKNDLTESDYAGGRGSDSCGLNSFSISWTGKGCETKARYKLGEIIRSGSNNDLSALGGDLFDWQDLELVVENRSATIYLNGRQAYHENYRENCGNIMALIYMFDGTGSIDHATLKDSNDKMFFRDTFDE